MGVVGVVNQGHREGPAAVSWLHRAALIQVLPHGQRPHQKQRFGGGGGGREGDGRGCRMLRAMCSLLEQILSPRSFPVNADPVMASPVIALSSV